MFPAFSVGSSISGSCQNEAFPGQSVHQFLKVVNLSIHVQGQCLVPMVSSEPLWGSCKFSESAYDAGFYTENLSILPPFFLQHHIIFKELVSWR